MQEKLPILEVKNLTKKYGEKVVLEDFNLSINAGGFFGLLGPNGAGKSTLIHCITGIGRITGGNIVVGGKDVVAEYQEARQQIGLSPQEFNVDIFATPRQLLDFVGGYYGLSITERKTRIEELLNQFDLNEHANKQFKELSGGLKRRVTLARALIHKPPLLILDEPTAGVDVEQRRSLWKYFRELNQAGTTIILTSHYLEEIQQLCDEVAVINKGKLLICESIADFTKEGSVEEKYLKLTGNNSV
ncbi:MAG: ABC transporter ATP-binding protein [Candidatus Paceibacterota bacterium]